MSKGDGGGVNVTYVGYFGQVSSGERRTKLTRATDIDAHLTKKRGKKATAANKKRKDKKETARLKEERKAENEARARYKAAPAEVTVLHVRHGAIVNERTVHRK